ncbi:serine hydrolase [Rhodocytophaga aerolata]|uniref:Serine hydrolase n=1 Tax=Rhodocytophaga aerolata TaxID=455078 RepID=A0ABT8R3A1_9BACT|nr:serine hydrolase [Rhodocytophaga aerolata]MDO1446586.1 serine hydrolase [Rhodocytophaga aerolata]
MKKFLFFISVLLTYATQTSAQTNEIATKADELMTAYTKQKKFSGSVLIARKGDILFEKGYGMANLEKKLPNTPDTEFRIASITKTFTSAIILRLAEQKKIALDDALTKFIPDYPNGEKIQIKHLLSHSSGIVSYTTLPDYFKTWINHSLTSKQTMEHFKNLPLEFQPGTRFGYSNSNYVLLSYIAEKVTGKELGSLYQQEIFSKLKVAHTGKDANNRTSEFQARGYITNPQTAEWIPANPMDITTPAGAGCIYSSVRDLYAWDRSLYTNAILSEQSKQMAFTPYQAGYGYGWQVGEKYGKKQVSHSGKSPDGFVTNLIRFPEQEVCIIFLSNYGDVDGRQLSDDLTALVFNEAYNLPKQKVEVTLDEEVLARYAGVYQLDPQFNVTISVEGNKLYALAVGDAEKMELTAEGINKFFMKGPEIEIEFIEENGKVQYMLIKMQGGKKLTKIS